MSQDIYSKLCREALLSGLPVEHLKDGLEVLRLAVLVLEAIDGLVRC